MQHDVLAALHLFHAVDAYQQAVSPVLLFVWDGNRRADQHGLTLEDDFGLPQMVRGEGRTGRHQIADHIRTAEARRNLDRTRQHHHFRGNAALREKARQDVRIGRCDAFSLERRRAAVLESVRNRDT